MNPTSVEQNSVQGSLPSPAPPSGAATAAERVLILEPGRVRSNYWSDLWVFRELFAILAWRDVAVQYKQTAIGVAWAVVRPLLTMVIFTIVFGRLARLPSVGEAPYPIMVMAGMLPWFLFSTILTQASNSLVANTNLISKVYFPRLIIPVASSVVAFVDFLVSLLVMLCIMAAYRFAPDWRMVFLPGFVILAFLSALGPSLMMAALNVKYRDFRFILPFVVQFGMYISPVGFSSTVVPEKYRLIYALNPVVSVIDGFRWCMLGDSAPIYLPGFFLGLAITALFLWIGVATFRSAEKTFADLI